MNRRALLVCAGSGLSAVAGCLLDTSSPVSDDEGGGAGDEHCASPDDDAETVAYDEILVIDNPDWLATEGIPDEEPHLVFFRSAGEADEWIDADALEDGRAFVEGTDFEESSLLVAEYVVSNGLELAIHGIERLGERTVYAYLCVEDHREEGVDYPAVDHLHSSVARISDDGATTARGRLTRAPPGAETVEIPAFGSGD